MSGNRSSASAGKRPGSSPASKASANGGSGSRGPWGRRIKKAVTWISVSGLLLVLVLAGIGFFTYQNTEIPDANRAFQAHNLETLEAALGWLATLGERGA